MEKTTYLKERLAWPLKILLFMKLCVAFILLMVFQATANTSYGQKNISLEMENVHLSKVLKTLQKNTDYRFVFSNKVVDDLGTVDVKVKDMPVLELLPSLLKGTGLEFLRMDDNLIVIREYTNSKKATNLSNNASVTGESLILLRQDVEVSGLVTDTSGKVLPGVNVYVKSKPSIGTTTDLNGRYILKVPENTVLAFSMVGFVTQEIRVGSKRNIDVKMKDDTQMLEEAVVVAYGNKVKKSDLIGAVTSINISELKVPSSNLTSALQGRVPGMISYQRSGEPGADNSDFFVRGVGTSGTSSRPLILIDNIESTSDDLARIPWDDLESFTVLKDASSTAVYGSRAANGVIMITTKMGKEGAAKVNVRVEQRISAPTQKLEIADPVTFMRMRREAVITRTPLLKDETYSLEKIARTAAGDDPIQFPAVDWLDYITKDVTTTRNFNLGVSGGGQTATYNVSANYTSDNGLLRFEPINDFNSNVKFNVFSFLTNISINLTKSTTLLARMKANLQDYNGPPVSGSDAYARALRSEPALFLPVYTPGEKQSYITHPLFGNYEDGAQYENAYAQIVRGYSERKRSNLSFQTNLFQDLSSIITEGLKFRALVNIERKSYYTQSRTYDPFYYQPSISPITGNVDKYLPLNQEQGTEYLDFEPGTRELGAALYSEAQISYDREFAQKHKVSGTLIGTIRNNISTPTNNDISLISTLPYRNLSFSGNASYSYDRRYRASFGFGYNGSEAFDKNARWGFFPSFGIGWSVSEEKFMESVRPIINNLRLRFTHGWGGNDKINNTRFFYLSDVDLDNGSHGYTFGIPGSSRSINGVLTRRYENPYVRWEISRKTNLGIDLGMFNGALQFSGELFKQLRYDIVQSRASIPASNGLQNDVLANLGKYESKGFEGELSYSKSVNKDLYFQARGTFTYATGGYVYFEEPNFQYPYLSRIGLNYDQQRGYVAERLFIDDDEVLNSPQQQFGGAQVLGGDIKYVDVNKDGVINANDLLPIGLPTSPEFVYGFGLTTKYKAFELGFFFTGLARTSLFVNPTANYDPNNNVYGTAPFGSRNSPNALFQAWADDHWSENNQNIYASWPRLSEQPLENNVQNSTFWMRNGSFLRLKQVELWYTLNQTLSRKLRINNMRVYFTATNLLRWSSFKLWDPEMGGNGSKYPVQRVFNFGINISI